jgi:RNA recognition motif-containing protein
LDQKTPRETSSGQQLAGCCLYAGACCRQRDLIKHRFEEFYKVNIYVGNLPYSVSDDDLRNAFAAYGEVSSVNIIMDRMTGQSKGFGFVEMNDNSHADAAIKGLNGSDLGGRNLTVNPAKPRAERSDRGPRY